MSDYTEYQKKLIRRFYDNREGGDEQRLKELCTDLYLAEGRKRTKLWETARTLLERLRVPPSRIEHVMKSADPVQLAEVVKELDAGTLKRVEKPKAE